MDTDNKQHYRLKRNAAKHYKPEISCNMDKELTGWEIEKSLGILVEAYENKQASDSLLHFLNNYKLSAVNKDFSILAVIRKCRVQYWNDERRVFPVAPNTEDFHWGLGIAKCNERGCSAGTLYLPNKFEYINLAIENNCIGIFTDQCTKFFTNKDIDKLAKFWRVFDEKELEIAFETLGTDSPISDPSEEFIEKNITSNDLINPFWGIIPYKMEINWFEKDYIDVASKLRINVTIDNSPLAIGLLNQAQKIVEEKLYVKLLEEAIPDILKLKNENWLAETEKRYTRRRILNKLVLEGLHCNENGSIELEYNALDIFGKHYIILIIKDLIYKSCLLG